jgi:catechol 2,3-dioxygenase-like lactoylglutathione lyase family enzyme
MRTTLLLTLAFCFPSLSSFAQEADAPVTKFANRSISIGLLVNDIEESKHFYVDLLGLVETRSFPIDEDFGIRSGLSDGVPFEVFIVKPEGADEATEIKLVQFEEPLDQKAEGPIQGSNGVRYITLFVDDVMAIVERLQADDIKLEGECPLKLRNGADFAVVKDPDGVFVELIGRGE